MYRWVVAWSPFCICLFKGFKANHTTRTCWAPNQLLKTATDLSLQHSRSFLQSHRRAVPPHWLLQVTLLFLRPSYSWLRYHTGSAVIVASSDGVGFHRYAWRPTINYCQLLFFNFFCSSVSKRYLNCSCAFFRPVCTSLSNFASHFSWNLLLLRWFVLFRVFSWCQSWR